MDHSVIMTVFDALQNLLDAFRRVSLWVELACDDVLKQLATGDQIKHKVVEVFLLKLERQFFI